MSAISHERTPEYHESSKREKINQHDIDSQIALEELDDPGSSTVSPGGATIVSFRPEDPGNPHNWSARKKVFIVFTGIMAVMNSTYGSSIASGATDELQPDFHLVNQEDLVLPTSIFLVGYVVGPLFFAPISESYGRKWVMIGAFALYTVFTLGCALAPNFPALVIFRFLCGIGASAPISVVGGMYADILPDPTTRGHAMTAYMAAVMFGPLLGPITSGFISVVSWRWTFWLALIVAGVTWPFLLACPETYGPVILKHRAQRLRKQNNGGSTASSLAPIELEDRSIKQLVTVVLTRPLRMLIFEAIVLSSCVYIAFAYAIFYMFFQAYPLIFTDIYGFNAGEEGLAFLAIGVGSTLGCAVHLYWDNFLHRAKSRDPPAPWTQKEEYRRLPLAIIGGPFFAISLFWMGWTARPSIHWIVPVLAGVPFGVGFLLIFQGLLCYVVDAYDVFAASALAASSTSRSLFGAVLPFAARPMYETLGVHWACTVLGCLSLAMCAIPFAFIRFGDLLRARSGFCRYLAERKRLEVEEGRLRKADG